jgi:hypothetical protein
VLAGLDEAEVSGLDLRRSGLGESALLRGERGGLAAQGLQLRVTLGREVEVGDEGAQRADREVEQHDEREQHRDAPDPIPADPRRCGTGLRAPGGL